MYHLAQNDDWQLLTLLCKMPYRTPRLLSLGTPARMDEGVSLCLSEEDRLGGPTVLQRTNTTVVSVTMEMSSCPPATVKLGPQAMTGMSY